MDPDRLRIGFVPALLDCLGHQDAACETAAGRTDDAGWQAWLRRQDGSGLSGDTRRVFLSLDCASGDGLSCGALARDLHADGDPLRASMVELRACALGDQASCDVLDIPLQHSPASAMYLISGGTSWAAPTRAAGPAPTDEELGNLAAACDGGTWPGACLDLTGAWWRPLGDPASRAAAVPALTTTCDAGHPAACALKEDATGAHPAPALPGIGASAEVLRRLCLDHEVGRACELTAELHALGRATPFGTAESRQLQQRACDEGLASGCDHTTAAYRTPLSVDAVRTCDAAEAGGPPAPTACYEASIAERFGVGTPKREPAEWRKRLSSACRMGDARSCAWLGDNLPALTAGSAEARPYEAAGLDPAKLDAKQRLGESFPLFERACELGESGFCGGWLAWRTTGDHGVAVDTAAAHQDYVTGCRGGGSAACAELATDGAQSRVSGVTPTQTYDAYLRACSLGSSAGCLGLGWALAQAHGTSFRPNEALGVLWDTCQTNRWACELIGQLYEQGVGVAADPGRALWAYDRACEKKATSACESATRLRGAGASPVPVSPVPLPALQATGGGAGSYGPAYGTRPPGVVDAPAEPERPAPRPRPTPTSSDDSTQLLWSLGAGGVRSWTLDAHSASLRTRLDVTRGLFTFGLGVDWLSNARSRPKVARTYFRIDGQVDVGLRIPLARVLDLRLGGGGTIGGYRSGPGKSSPLVTAYGPYEYLTFDAHLGALSVGVRVEQHQWFQGVDGLELDHATGIYGMIGVRLDD